MSSPTSTNKIHTPVKSKSENFAHNSNNSNGVSLVVPRVFPNWNYRKIKEVFIKCGWGYVERVDVIPVGRIPKGRFKTAFVHFRPNSWNNRDQQAQDVLEKLSKGPENNIQITYDEPWYWKVFISSAERPDEAPKAPPRPAIKLELKVDTNIGCQEMEEDKLFDDWVGTASEALGEKTDEEHHYVAREGPMVEYDRLDHKEEMAEKAE